MKKDWWPILLSCLREEIEYCRLTGHVRARTRGGEWRETEEGQQIDAVKYAEEKGRELLAEKRNEPLGAIVLRKK